MLSGPVTINNPGSVTVNGGGGGSPPPPKADTSWRGRMEKAMRSVGDFMGKTTHAANGLQAALGGVGKAFGAALGAAQSMAHQYVGLFNPAAVLRLDIAVNDLYASIGEALVPVVDNATVGIRAVADAIAGLSPQGKTAIAMLGGAAVGLAVTAVAAGALAVAVNAATLGIPALVAGLAAIGVGAAAGAALATGGGGFAKAMGGFKTLLGTVMETVGGVVVKLAEALQPGMAAVAAGLGTAIKAVFGAMSGAGDVAGGMGRAFGSLVAVGGKLLAAVGQLSAPFVGLGQILGAVLGPALEAAGMALNLLLLPLKPLGAVMAAIGGAFGRFAGVLSRSFERAMSTIRPAVAAIEKAFDQVANAIGGAMSSALESAMPYLETAADWLGQIVVGVAKGIKYVADTMTALIEIAKRFGLVSDLDKPEDDKHPSANKAIRSVGLGSVSAAIDRSHQAAASAGRAGETYAQTTAKNSGTIITKLDEVKKAIENQPAKNTHPQQTTAERVSAALPDSVNNFLLAMPI